jgi:DNA-binding CsgD family transcriptional regulator
MQQSVSPGEMYSFPLTSSVNTEYQMYAYYLVQIVDCFQRFYGNADYSEAQIASEISTATQDHFQLHFLRQSPLSSVTIPYIAGRRGFLVRWGNEIYGSLQVKLIDEFSDQYILPIPLCERLAQDCAWGLHVLEKEVQHQRQKQKYKGEVERKVSALSSAQRTILELMVKSFSTREIAEMLHLSKRTVETHQRNIYQLLDVHSQREAVLMGLAAGLTAR